MSSGNCCSATMPKTSRCPMKWRCFETTVATDWPDALSPWECRCGAVWSHVEDEEGEDSALLSPWSPPDDSPAGDEEGERSDASALQPAGVPAPSSVIDVLCRRAQSACKAELGPKIRSALMAAYDEDPIGTAAMAEALLRGNTDTPIKKRKRKTSAQKRASLQLTATELVVAACALDAAATGRANASHPKSQAGKFITSSEGVEICFTFAKNSCDACPDPCRNKRAHICQICLGPHRNERCDRLNNLGKGRKGERGR